MTEMTEAQKVIHGVLATHVASTRRIQHPKREGFLLNVAACDSESCDWVASDVTTDHDEHLAAEIDKALGGLTQEHAIRSQAYDDTSMTGDFDDLIDEIDLFSADHRIESRWVSGWSEAQS